MSQALDREITNLHLQDETIYCRVTEKEFHMQCKRLNHVWMSMEKSVGLDERFVSRLKLDKPACPVFYSLIRTHKLKLDEINLTSAATFKIRPIISCVGGPTDRISRFLNKIETRMRDRTVISIESYTCGDADENKVGGYAIAVMNDYKNLVEEFGSASSRCAFLRLRDRRERKLWIDELNALMSKIPSQQVVIIGIDANAKMGLQQQSDVLGKWYYPAERTSDNGDRLVDLCEQTGLIIASTFRRNHRRHQLTWQGSTLLTPEEQLLCIACGTGDFNQKKRLRKKLCRQLQQDRDNECTSKAKAFEKTWGDKKLRKPMLY
ncbi:hypothetical protein RB195_005702 [Necator americanus]|uniref:Uncharacterized protein n=1 Tax=Necator americanus TaxID=51031 RepID=A0ABR1BSA6_NECAM